jgi:hypothetical protein
MYGQSFIKEKRCFPISALRGLYGFSLILNDVWSDDGLDRRPKLVTDVKLSIVLLHDGVFNEYIVWHLSGALE